MFRAKLDVSFQGIEIGPSLMTDSRDIYHIQKKFTLPSLLLIIPWRYLGLAIDLVAKDIDPATMTIFDGRIWKQVACPP